MTINEGAGTDPPYIKGFLILLPEGIPVPDNALWVTATDELEPLLDDAALAPVDGMAPLPSDGVGRNFVSLRFWHIMDESEPSFESDIRHLMKAFDRLHPPPDIEDYSEFETGSNTEEMHRYRVAVEAVTFVASNNDLIATEKKPDPLTRCLNEVLKWHRAYRIISELPVEELTYAKLFPLVPSFRRSLEGTVIEPDGLITLASDNFKFGSWSEFIGQVDTPTLTVALARVGLGDPLTSFAERRVDARHALLKEGNFAGAVIQFAIACEVLLDSLLGMTLWEAGTNEADAAVIFSMEIAPRIRTQYAHRLGGNWQLGSGALGDWDANVAALRNRVVHAGYRPTRAEAFRASESFDALTQFVADRVCEKFRVYPKTSWLILGQRGFETRSRYSRPVKEWISAQPTNAVLDWIREYTEWRDRVNALVQRRRRSSN
ncbi:hypothetical protein [Nocardia grenadensis]|uniref:hypothetical protein n=1 Tax=Nocardia grenadensis TaxID=931537 RepID=UPI003D71DA4D